MKEKIAEILDNHDLSSLLDLCIDSRHDSIGELCTLLLDLFPDLNALCHPGTYREFDEGLELYLKERYPIDIDYFSYSGIKRKTEQV